jgi:hypothetical protein
MKYSKVLQNYYLVQKHLKNVTPQKHVIANSGSAPAKNRNFKLALRKISAQFIILI